MDTTNVLNGEVKCGDWILSMPNDVCCGYGCLVGEVIEITKIGTPEHGAGSDNDTDDVHVDFRAFSYPPERIAEIEETFSSLYGAPKTFGELPLDDTVMAPDMLIRITELGHGRINSMGSSLAECEAFCSRFTQAESADAACFLASNEQAQPPLEDEDELEM